MYYASRYVFIIPLSSVCILGVKMFSYFSTQITSTEPISRCMLQYIALLLRFQEAGVSNSNVEPVRFFIEPVSISKQVPHKWPLHRSFTMLLIPH